MKKHKKLILIISGIIVLLLLISFFTFHKKSTTTASLPATLVELSTVTVGDIPLTATALGSLVANQQTDISPKVGGYISKILFKEGDFVPADTLLIQLDNEKEQNDLAAAKADAALSALQYDRENKAFKKGLILQDDVYNAKVTNEKNLALVKADETALADMALTAPFSGYVGSRNVSIGDYVSPGQKLLTLVDQHHLRVEYALPSQLAPQLQVGQSAVISADFLPGKTRTAQVTFISPYIDTDSQTIAIHALLDNEQGDFKPGEFVNVKQNLGVLSHVMLVPENSVFASVNGYHVFTVKNNQAVSVPVKIGVHVFGQVQIITGLKPNDQIITVGQNQIKAGSAVTVVPTKKSS